MNQLVQIQIEITLTIIIIHTLKDEIIIKQNKIKLIIQFNTVILNTLKYNYTINST